MKAALFYLFSSFWAGAVHAATPGHGKTIAAAYIVGARGKPIDAVILGIFVTLSHTSGIVIVGVLASLGSAWFVPQRAEAYLALAMGLLVVGLGAWMLWTQRRLLPLVFGEQRPMLGPEAVAARIGSAVATSEFAVAEPHTHSADWHDHGHGHDHAHGHDHPHVHSHGDGHHHAHDHAHGHHHHPDHSHDHNQGHSHGHDHVHDDEAHHGHAHAADAGWHSHGWGTYHAHRLDLVTDNRPKLAVLLALSIAGGLLPDPAALAILLAALSSGRVMLGVATVLVFSVGFASALVVVGVIAAQIGRKIERWLNSIWAIRVQVATSALILAMGLVLTAKAAYQLGV